MLCLASLQFWNVSTQYKLLNMFHTEVTTFGKFGTRSLVTWLFYVDPFSLKSAVRLGLNIMLFIIYHGIELYIMLFTKSWLYLLHDSHWQ